MKKVLKLIEFSFALMFLGIFMIPSFEEFFGMETESLYYLGEIFERIGIVLSWIWLILQIVMLVLQRSGITSSGSAGGGTSSGRPGGTAPGGRPGSP